MRFVLAATVVVVAALFGSGPGALACTLPTDCDDGLLCNGVEICNLGTSLCEPGVPLPDNTLCDSGDTCTLIDTCQAGVCVAGGGGDGDGDGICNAEDNCAAVANPSQQDVDGDHAGDACDPIDRVLNIIVARLARNVSINPLKPRGRVYVKGEFLNTLPEPALDDSSGFLVRLQDGVGLDETYAWTAAECAPTGVAIKCASHDRFLKLTITPVGGSSGHLRRFSVRLSRLSIGGTGGPFFTPITLTITNGPAVLVSGIDRNGSILDCAQSASGISCRE